MVIVRAQPGAVAGIGIMRYVNGESLYAKFICLASLVIYIKVCITAVSLDYNVYSKIIIIIYLSVLLLVLPLLLVYKKYYMYEDNDVQFIDTYYIECSEYTVKTKGIYAYNKYILYKVLIGILIVLPISICIPIIYVIAWINSNNIFIENDTILLTVHLVMITIPVLVIYINYIHYEIAYYKYGKTATIYFGVYNGEDTLTAQNDKACIVAYSRSLSKSVSLMSRGNPFIPVDYIVVYGTQKDANMLYNYVRHAVYINGIVCGYTIRGKSNVNNITNSDN